MACWLRVRVGNHGAHIALTAQREDVGGEAPLRAFYGLVGRLRVSSPIVEGTSLMHLHLNRGKRSVVLDLRTPEGAEVFRDLVRGADAVVEAMRPGGPAPWSP